MARFPARACLAVAWLLFNDGFAASGATQLPSPPRRHFNDFTGTITPSVATDLDQRLVEFERATSSQVVVAVFESLPAGQVLEDHAVALFRHWAIGSKDRNNGALLLVFLKDRALRIEVGYGLEGAIPDATASRIINDEIVPSFRAGRFDEGLQRGVTALLAAARGEYTGTGRTVADQQGGRPRGIAPFVPFILFFMLWAFILAKARRRRGWVIGPGGRNVYTPGWGMGPGGFGRGHGGGGFGGGGFGGGGGFRGGGGFSGGGGASGRW
jgi:uncharacterized protein